MCVQSYAMSVNLCLLSFPRTVHGDHPCCVFSTCVVWDELLGFSPEVATGEALGHLDGRSIWSRNPGWSLADLRPLQLYLTPAKPNPVCTTGL